MLALKQIPKQDYEVDLIDDNRQTLIDQERVEYFRFYFYLLINQLFVFRIVQENQLLMIQQSIQ
jgi:hypothetical protein